MTTLGSPGCWNPRLLGLIKFIRLGRLRKWYLGDMDPKQIKTLSIFSTWASNIRENTSWTQTSIPWPKTPGDPIPPQALSDQLGREITQFRFLAQDMFQHWGRRWKVRRYIGHFTFKEWSTKASLLLRTLFKPQALPKKMSQSRLIEKGQGIKISSPMLRNPIFDFFASKRQSDGPIGGSQKFGRKSKS